MEWACDAGSNVEWFNKEIALTLGLAVEDTPRTAQTAPVPGSVFAGGTDPLHLCNNHGLIPVWDDGLQPPSVKISSKVNRSAYISLDRYVGWYLHLHRLGNGLPPPPGNRSWKVTVSCGPMSHIGEFRRSRVTGRWFAGQHSIHMLGA